MAVANNLVRLYTDTLSTIKATEHRMDLDQDTKPMRHDPYRAVPTFRKVFEQHMKNKLDGGFIELAQVEGPGL